MYNHDFLQALVLVKSYIAWKMLGVLARKPLFFATFSLKIYFKPILCGYTLFLYPVLYRDRFLLSPFSAETVDRNTSFCDSFSIKLKCRIFGQFHEIVIGHLL